MDSLDHLGQVARTDNLGRLAHVESPAQLARPEPEVYPDCAENPELQELTVAPALAERLGYKVLLDPLAKWDQRDQLEPVERQAPEESLEAQEPLVRTAINLV